ncbi:hypothetical protein [Candidatus Nitrosotalea sp. TS]|uniref:hypothetical protein n=1 Tax=Candidatus Nitrosotalea sp. TS TaxID=2341020 RepID=UPI00140DC263|nr:hypothetical protein [Candidatus Nitrosotalea sp. TS]
MTYSLIAIIVGDGVSPGMRNNPHENPHLSFMMNVLFMILCRKIPSGDPASYCRINLLIKTRENLLHSSVKI